MSNLTKIAFPLGWTPSSDHVGGNPNGLLRMDNLHTEEEGAITLDRGIQKFGSALDDFVETFFPRGDESNDVLYIGDGSGGAYKSINLGSTTKLFQGDDHVAFGDAFGKTLICAGSSKKKEHNGTLTNLGIQKPAAKPTAAPVNQPKKDLATGTWSRIEGHDSTVLGASIQCFVDSTTLQGVVEMDLGATVDTTNLGTSGPYDVTKDTFTYLLQTHDKALFTKVRIEIHMDDENYYWHEWPIADDSSVNVGINAQSVLSALRGDFTREGSDATLNWTKVTKIRFTATATADVYFLVGEQQFLGGAAGVLNGFYKYCAVAVANDGTYLGKSPKSDDSDIVYVSNGMVPVTVVASPDAQVTEYWIFRRSVVQQVDTNLIQSHLDRWYRVGVGSTLNDNMSDTDAIELGITLDETLQSVGDLTDSILSIEGMYNERMLYMTFNQLILSDRLNPDGYIPGQAIRVSGDTNEKNLWVRKVSNSTLVLATTKDLYEISGTLEDFPDGTLDVYVRPIGEAFPPLGLHVASEEGILYYVAKDGIRGTSGSNSSLLSAQLSQLFQGRDSVNGVPSVAIIPGSVGDYALATGRNKLYTTVPMSDGSRRLLVYSFITQTWRLRYTDPTAVGSTVSGRIVVGYGSDGGNFVRELEKDTGVDGSGGLPFTLQTVFDSNDQPRNRKDTFTLKLVMDTGGKTVQIAMAKDGGTYTNLRQLSSNGLATKFVKLTGVTLGFRYSLKITDVSSDIEVFKLNEYTIEYDPRPEQVDYLRIPSTNLGTSDRKRLIQFAFVIDTLGQNVTFTPVIDGVAGTPSTVNTDGKRTYIHYFTDNEEGIDVGGILESTSEDNPFEFYQVDLADCLSEKMPAAAKFLVIPANDYGTPNRKRFTSYKFQINTRGHDVTLVPRVDGVNYTSGVFNTTEKRTVDYFFPVDLDVAGIDIGGTLSGVNPFEFYGTIVPQEVEILPARLKSLYLPTTNYGTAARKRVRTTPMVIDTHGGNVLFTPVVDGVVIDDAAIFNTNYPQTVFQFFDLDVLGYDFRGILTSLDDTYFEFYKYEENLSVEVLPVEKKYDQSQPFRFDKIAKIFAVRVRLIAQTAEALPISIIGSENVSEPYGTTIWSDSMATQTGVDTVYESLLPKSVNTTIFRVIIGPSIRPFHRYDIQVRVAASGMESDSQWVTLK